MGLRNDLHDTHKYLKEKADKIANVPTVSSAPTASDFNTLVNAFNQLLAELRKK